MLIYVIIMWWNNGMSNLEMLPSPLPLPTYTLAVYKLY